MQLRERSKDKQDEGYYRVLRNYRRSRQRQQQSLRSRSATPIGDRDHQIAADTLFDVEEANKLNTNVQFSVARTVTLSLRVKIRYNSSKLLDFDRLLHLKPSVPFELAAGNKANLVDEAPHTLDPQIQDLYGSIYKLRRDANVTNTTPTVKDRIRFNETLKASQTAKFYNSNISPTFQQNIGQLPAIYTNHTAPIRASSVKYLFINNHEIETLFPSPFPQQINSNVMIYMCQSCFKYTSSRYQHIRHMSKCIQLPPGDEIYKDGDLSVFEVDGREALEYCRNLCLLSMLFLKSKTLYFEVESFVFYVLYLNGNFIGYFSKEKLNSAGFNLSCILTLPPYRRLGFGVFLMEFSYLLSRMEYKVGTPEKPLSDLGLLTYRYFWKNKVAEALVKLHTLGASDVSLGELSSLTGMIPKDILFGLERLNVLFKKTEGETTKFAIIVDDWKRIEEVNKKWQEQKKWKLKEGNLIWKPMIFGPSSGINSVNFNVPETASNDGEAESESTSNCDDMNDTVAKLATGSTSNEEDFFNKHVSLLVNFMSDDIFDSRSMEQLAVDKINGRLITQTENTASNNLASVKSSSELKWQLCHPDLAIRAQTSRIGRGRHGPRKSGRNSPINIEEKPKAVDYSPQEDGEEAEEELPLAVDVHDSNSEDQDYIDDNGENSSSTTDEDEEERM